MECIQKRNLLLSLHHSGYENCKCRCKKIQCGTAYGLVCFQIHRCKCVKQGKYTACNAGNQDSQNHERLSAQSIFKGINKQYTGKGSHNHDTFHCDINDTASLCKHSAQSYHQKRYGKKHGLLNYEIKNIHDFSASLLLLLMNFIITFLNSNANAPK